MTEDPTAPEQESQLESSSTSRRRPILALVLVVVIVLAIVLALRLTGGDSSGDRADDGGSGGAGAGGTVPTPPASAPSRGSYVESTVASDGTVSVRQWTRSSTQIRSLELAVVDPEGSGSAGARAEDVVVQALNGSVLATKDSVGTGTVRLALKTSVPNIYLSYRITGGIDDASQSVPGRTLVTVLGMDVDFSGATGTVQHLVSGPGKVTNVACLRVSDDSGTPPKACGAPTDDGDWLVTLRGIDRTDRLLAQLGMDS